MCNVYVVIVVKVFCDHVGLIPVVDMHGLKFIWCLFCTLHHFEMFYTLV